KRQENHAGRLHSCRQERKETGQQHPPTGISLGEDNEIDQEFEENDYHFRDGDAAQHEEVGLQCEQGETQQKSLGRKLEPQNAPEKHKNRATAHGGKNPRGRESDANEREKKIVR